MFMIDIIRLRVLGGAREEALGLLAGGAGHGSKRGRRAPSRGCRRALPYQLQHNLSIHYELIIL